MPGALTGTLTDNGIAVTADKHVSVDDMNGGLLVFTPAANANGLAESIFTFQIQQNSGCLSDCGYDDHSSNTMTINVTSVNDAPAGTDNTVTTNEDTAHTFTALEFGFSDANDSEAKTLPADDSTAATGDLTVWLNDNSSAVLARQLGY